MLTYVLNRNGEPLMPTKRSGKVRRLLKEKNAKVVKRSPFTIRLLYDTGNAVSALTHGIDTGSAHIGSAVSDDEGNIYYVAEIEVRNDIKAKMDARRKYRRNRRNRKTRYRKPRFDNRGNSKRKDRLNTTMTSKIHAHEREIAFVASILPISHLVLETGQFDMAAMKDPSIRSKKKIHWAYQEGPNYSYANTKAMIRARDSYTCQHCKGKRKDSRLDVHHIVFRSKGGSDEPENLITLCRTCHKMLHDGKIDPKLKGKAKGVLAHASQMNVIRNQLLKRYPDAIQTFGYVTSENRQLCDLPKEHYIDAAVIASGGRDVNFRTDILLRKRCVAKGDYAKTMGVRSEKAVSPKKIGGFRRYDKVRYRNNEYFIKGRMTTGYAVLMDIFGKTQKFENPKTVKLGSCIRLAARGSVLCISQRIEANTA